MTLVLEVVVPLVGGGLAALLAARGPRLGLGVTAAAAAATAIVALVGPVDATLSIGLDGLRSSEVARILVIAWSSGATLLALLGFIDRSAGDAALAGAGGLLALSSVVVALGVDDGTVAFAALALGGLAAVSLPLLGGRLVGDERAAIGPAARALAAVGGAGLVAITVAAFGHAVAGPPTGNAGSASVAAAGSAAGLAAVAMAAALVLRSGAIPAHLWAARLVGGMSLLAVPGVLGWGVAAFAIVAVGWGATSLSLPIDDLDRAVVAVVAIASIAFGGLASLLHDDIEHVLGYVIVQDAGVALLALASLRPEVADPLATWVIAAAAVSAAFAGWIVAARWAFGVHRLRQLQGWARRSPLLGVAFAAILIGSIGVPGAGIFAARVALASAALPGVIAAPVVAIALSPLLALGRILATGIGRPSPVVAGADDRRVGRAPGASGWSRGGIAGLGRAAAGFVRANEGLGVAAVTILLALVGLAFAMVGTGSGASA